VAIFRKAAIVFGCGLASAPAIFGNLKPRFETLDGPVSEFYLVCTIFCWLIVLAAPLARRNAKTLGHRLLCRFALLFGMAGGYFLGLQSVDELYRDSTKQARKEAATIEDLNTRLETARKERGWVPKHVRTTREMVQLAERAVEDAERSRNAECDRKNGGRGPFCNQRETALAVARTALTQTLADRQVTEQLAALDAEIRTLEQQLTGRRAPPLNPWMEQIANALKLFGVTFENPDKAAETVGQWAPHALMVGVEFANWLGSVIFVAALLGPEETDMRPMRKSIWRRRKPLLRLLRQRWRAVLSIAVPAAPPVAPAATSPAAPLCGTSAAPGAVNICGASAVAAAATPRQPNEISGAAPTAPAANDPPQEVPQRPAARAAKRTAGPSRKARKDAALADLLTRLALGERFGSQDELANRYGVPKSTMSDWLREWEAAALIPERRTVGRFKQVERA
jgi:hypothetical protein